MSLIQLRDGLSLSLILVSALAILFGGGSSLLVFTIFAGCCLLAFLSPRWISLPQIGPRIWTMIISAGLVASIARAWYLRDILDSGLEFILLLIVQRIFHRQKVREHLQLLLLTSILMIIAAIINTELSYPLLLTVFLPLATLTMMLNLVLAEVDRLQLRTTSNPWSKPQEQWRTLTRASLGVSAMAGVTGLIVFVATPRVGVGIFLRGSINRDPVSGFSDAVTLGGFGRIRTNQKIIMRMTPIEPSKTKDYLPIYLRGSAFDHYENGSWSHSPKAFRSPLSRKGGFYQLPANRRRVAPNAPKMRMMVTLEDIGSDLLFAASPALGVSLRSHHNPLKARNRVYGGVDGQFVVIDKQPGPIRYEFLSLHSESTPYNLESIVTDSFSPEFSPYLNPLLSSSDRVRNLAFDLTRDADTPLAKVNAIMDHLAQFTYTLELPNISPQNQQSVDPIETFLFETKQGHCEYFATAMAILLREVGIPTRNVNGYLGASWNNIGQYYFVRQSNAHSWVEVYFDSAGWITFDPTPSAARLPENQGSIARLSQWMDALHNRYLDWIVDFDLSKQRSLFRGSRTSNAANSNATGPGFSWKQPWIWIVASTGLGIASFWIRRRRRPTLNEHQKLLLRLFSILNKAGITPRSDESNRCFAQRVIEQFPGIRDPLLQFVQTYESVRFSSFSPSPPLSQPNRSLSEEPARLQREKLQPTANEFHHATQHLQSLLKIIQHSLNTNPTPSKTSSPKQ